MPESNWERHSFLLTCVGMRGFLLTACGVDALLPSLPTDEGEGKEISFSGAKLGDLGGLGDDGDKGILWNYCNPADDLCGCG